MKTVAEFVTEHGIGEVFTAGDPDSAAEAINRGLVGHAALSARITTDLLVSLSWEHQGGPLSSCTANSPV